MCKYCFFPSHWIKNLGRDWMDVIRCFSTCSTNIDKMSIRPYGFVCQSYKEARTEHFFAHKSYLWKGKEQPKGKRKWKLEFPSTLLIHILLFPTMKACDELLQFHKSLCSLEGSITHLWSLSVTILTHSDQESIRLPVINCKSVTAMPSDTTLNKSSTAWCFSHSFIIKTGSQREKFSPIEFLHHK